MPDPRSITVRLAAHGISHSPAPTYGQRILRNIAGDEIARCDVVGAIALLDELDAPSPIGRKGQPT